jgi:hypothetical protein
LTGRSREGGNTSRIVDPALVVGWCSLVAEQKNNADYHGQNEDHPTDGSPEHDVEAHAALS